MYYQPHTVVFYNRVVGAAEPLGVPKLLAHVLAHEIAHQLENTGRHSEAGIMKAHWNPSDILELSYRPMSFTAVDASLIRGGLAQRQAPQISRTAP